MINKKLLLVIIFLSFFCFPKLQSQTKKGKQPLIEILDKLHSKFECNFSYIDNDIAEVFIEPPPNNFDLEDAVLYLQSNTPLRFTILGDNFITITKKRKSGFSICGYLIDISSGLTIKGAVVQTKTVQTLTNEMGYFELNDPGQDEIITFRHLSYELFTEYVNKYEGGQQCETIYLESKTENLTEIILKDFITNGINKIIDGSININYRNFGTIPGLIETDVLQTIQALSGIQSIDETVSNINIRGGTHDQNLILWDGVKVYQSGHFFGLISALNPRITKRVSLIKNGSSAHYSEGVSGTIDMTTDHLVNKELQAEVGANFINADVFVDVPLNASSSVQIGARKSLSEYLDTPTYSQYYDRAFQNTDVVVSTNNSNSTDQEFDFYDISLRWLYEISEKDKLRLNLLNLNNSLNIIENAFGGGLSSSRESNLDQQNFAGGLYFQRDWSDNFHSSLQVYGTDYTLDALNFDILEEQRLVQKNEVLEYGLNLMTGVSLNDKLWLNNGYHFVETAITNSEELNSPPVDISLKETVQTHAISSELAYSSSNQNTHLKVGGRLNYIQAFEKFILEPRLSFNHRMTDRFTLEILGEFKNQTNTFVTDFRNNFLGIERRRWTLSNNMDIPILESKQISVGTNYKHKGFVFNTEVYYKNVNGITSRSQGFQNQYEFEDTTGSYDVMGFDFLINHRYSKFNTWLGYTYADNRYTFKELEEVQFPSNLDISHTVSFATAYKIKNLKLSAGFNWRTGKPNTGLVEGNELVNGSLNYEAANSSNLEDYARVDASVIYNFNISKNIKAESALSVLNILDKQNIINSYYIIDEDNSAQRIDEYSLGVTPNFALRVFF